ncbi:hypothetical protein [Streptomyces tendae]|uniref:hypothetical protein n=1 Tax=Streptomyces tendae TaxID=1932 RepID=UPI0037222EF2
MTATPGIPGCPDLTNDRDQPTKKGMDPCDVVALPDGRRAPIWTTKKELKLQFFPGQILTWLGLILTTEGKVIRILFSAVQQDAAPAVVGEARRLTGDDFLTAGTDDRYLDAFRLTPDTRRDSRWPRGV